MTSRRSRISLVVLGLAGCVIVGLVVACWQPAVRGALAPVHDGLYLWIRGEWFTRYSPLSQLILAALGLLALYFWLCWILRVRSLRGILLGILAVIIRYDRQSRIFRKFLSLQARMGNATGRRSRSRNRPGWVSRSYLQVLDSVIDEEERRFHGGGEEQVQRSLGAHLRGYGELFLVPGTNPDQWSLRRAIYYLGEAASAGEPCEERLGDVIALALRKMFPGGPGEAGDALSISRLFRTLDDPEDRTDSTLILLYLINRYLLHPGPGLGVGIRARIEAYAAELLLMSRSLASRGRLSYAEVRERRRKMGELSTSSIGTFHLLSIAPGYARLLRAQGDTPALRAWVDLLEEVSFLYPRIRSIRTAERILPQLARDIGDGQLLDPRIPPAVQVELMRAEEEGGESRNNHAVEARFELLVS